MFVSLVVYLIDLLIVCLFGVLHRQQWPEPFDWPLGSKDAQYQNCIIARNARSFAAIET